MVGAPSLALYIIITPGGRDTPGAPEALSSLPGWGSGPRVQPSDPLVLPG